LLKRLQDIVTKIELVSSLELELMLFSNFRHELNTSLIW